MASQLHAYAILDQAQEDALHATRLLNFEERPFHRVTRNLLGKESLLKWTPPQQLPSPPPEGAEKDAETTAQTAPAAEEEAQKKKLSIYREEILLDFAALSSSLLRIQLLLTSNAQERARYATLKAQILETASAVRENTTLLRSQLAEAQRVLELRKGYDELAARLIDPRKLKARGETREDIAGLEKEIEDLELETRDIDGLWLGRREAFESVVEEGKGLIRVVKGIKDEPEHEQEKDDNGMEVEDGGVGKGEREDRSHVGTPAGAGEERTPMAGDVNTPIPEGDGDGDVDAEGETGEDGQPVAMTNKFLDVEDEGTRGSSQAGTPPISDAGHGQADVEMAEGHDDDEEAPLQPQPKTTAGMEVTNDQVATPANGMEGTEDQPENTAATGVVEFLPEQQLEEQDVATPAEVVEEMDES